MKNKTNSIIMKSRSANSCIRKGYELYLKNIKETIKRTWPIALLYAAVCSALFTVLTINIPKNIIQYAASLNDPGSIPPNIILNLLPIAGLIIIGGLFEILIYSLVISSISKGFQDKSVSYKIWLNPTYKTTFVRTLIAAVFSILITVLVAAVIFIAPYPFTGNHASVSNFSIPAVAILLLQFIVLAVILLPLTYIDMKYILKTDTSFWKLIAKDYRIALKHFGFILIVMSASLILIGIAEYILTLPARIMTIANYQASVGILKGDNINMPDYIIYISAIVFFIAGFIQVYVRTSAIFTSFYMYGSIETQEIERKSLKEPSKDNQD